MANDVARRMDTATLKDVRLMFRNFSGKGGQFNREGDRNFVVFLPYDVARAMEADGWNIKQLKPREEDEHPQDYLSVKVKFDGPRPPKVNLINSKGRHELDESDVSILDWVEIAKADLIVSPYNWEVQGRTGVTAYLRTLFVTIREDELELEYSDVPDAPDSAQNVLVWQESGNDDDILELEQ